jgi:hypothetical protein
MPFKFEGPKRIRQAERGLADLASTVDTVISIPNDRLMKLAPKGTSFLEAFKMADDVLRQAVQGISEIMLTPGVINRDFSDIKAIMSGMGHAMMGTATASGESAAVDAARAAISSPLLEEHGVEGARVSQYGATNHRFAARGLRWRIGENPRRRAAYERSWSQCPRYSLWDWMSMPRRSQWRLPKRGEEVRSLGAIPNRMEAVRKLVGKLGR